MRITARLFEVVSGDNTITDAAIQGLVGQTPRLNGAATGTATITRAWTEDGWVHAELEVPDNLGVS